MLVGDTSVGKSCLITNYLNDTFNSDYEPTVLDVYRGNRNICGKTMELEIHDTSGDELFGVNRTMQFSNADIYMVCVAANNPKTLTSVDKWIKEIRIVSKTQPVVLV